MPGHSSLYATSPPLDAAGEQSERLFELAPVAQVLVDPYADRLLAVNAAARRLIGCEAQEVSSMLPSHLMGEEFAHLIVFTQAVLEKGTAWSDGLSCRRGDGQVRRVECHAAHREP